MTKVTAKVVELQSQQNEPLPGIDAFLGGFYTSALEKKGATKPTHSNSLLTVGIRRPGFPLCYVNMSLKTDLNTGLTELVYMKTQSQSQFNASKLLSFSEKANDKTLQGKTRSKAKIEVVNTEEVRDELDDVVDGLLEVVEK